MNVFKESQTTHHPGEHGYLMNCGILPNVDCRFHGSDEIAGQNFKPDLTRSSSWHLLW